MNTNHPPRLDAALFLDIPSIAALAARCAVAGNALPGIDDPDVQRFVRMARAVDPRPMLLDEEFDLRFRFDLFASMTAPLADLARSYGLAYDLRHGRDQYFSIYFEALRMTVRALCAGLELFSSVLASATNATASLRGTIVDAQHNFEQELSKLLLRVMRVLEQPDLLSADEEVTMICAVEGAALRLASAATRTPAPAALQGGATRNV